MARHTLAMSLALSAALAGAACSGDEEKMQTTSAQAETHAQPANTPLTVAGCLKAGDAADTYVVTTARSEGGGETATYQLVGGETANLRDHIGRRVEVTGTWRSEQEIATRETARPADQPTGTSGTPTVQTRSQIELRQLSVTSVKPLDEKCEM